MTTAKDVRAQLINALRLDLIGPRPGHPPHDGYADEVLPIAPSKWYLTGFLVPYEAKLAQRTDDDGDDQLDQVDRPRDADDDNAPEPASARKAFFPSSLGLSMLVPEEARSLTATVAWGDYVPLGQEEDAERAGRGRWQRVPREARCDIPLDAAEHRTVKLPGHPHLHLVVSVRAVADHGSLPVGTRAVSVFLVNHRDPAPDETRDAAFVFQPELVLQCTPGFVPRPDAHGLSSDDWDERVADLQYRDAYEYAVGHNISALASKASGGPCTEVRSAWMPTADVEKVVPKALPDVELGMEALAGAASAQAVRDMVGPMVTAYGAWLAEQAKALPEDQERHDLGEELLKRAGQARGRIQAGLDALDDPAIFEAFRLANQAIATAIRQRNCHDQKDADPAAVKPPAWRPFQLAFLVMNITGTADAAHPDRRVVDLLFFPTGGGKTEAYLGLAAFTMFLRRLRDPSIHSAGVSVLMRYTLRLLTLDQLGRASTLMCAMELMRQQDVEKLGKWPFEIGLWVGRGATPNRMGRKGDGQDTTARARTIAYQNDPGHKPSPIPIENCPWCGWRLTRDSFRLLPDADQPLDLRVTCESRKCAFHARRQPRGIPVLTVDDPIYRRLPAFIIATVDKFANLPWVGETAGLFGRVDHHDQQGFYGPWAKGQGTALDHPLPPPDLVIQDELHLISGPLGTMVGLYETAIDALCTDPVGGGGAGPKIVASTATVRRAQRQIRGLFGRTDVEVFPPPGPDRRDSFFAITVSPEKRNPRTYVGVAAQGRNLKVVFLRTTLALMAAAQKAWQDNGGAKNPDNPSDPYMTLLGYFNSLRELGGSRRIIEDEVKSRLADYATRRTRENEPEPLFADRKQVSNEPSELTSRVNTSQVADTKRRLALPFADKEHLDVALATNMISVGLDISRLGLMVVLGQPKTAAEYIQATSRVGRDDERPGLVVTLLNVYRPRDRSYYERFAAWHESFYRAVEATSVTPFSPRAIDRGIAGVTVALSRLGLPALTPPKAAAAVGQHRPEIAFVADVVSQRAAGHDNLDAADAEALRTKVRNRVVSLLDAWERVATDKDNVLQYNKWEAGGAPPLLFDPLDPALAKQPRDAQQFKANRSLRDVEPSVNLWLGKPDGK